MNSGLIVIGICVAVMIGSGIWMVYLVKTGKHKKKRG